MVSRLALLTLLVTVFCASLTPSPARAKGSTYIVAATLNGGELARPATVSVRLPENLDDMFEMEAPSGVDGASLPYELTLHYDFSEQGQGKRDWVGRYDGKSTLYFPESMVVGPGVWAAGWYTAVDVLADVLSRAAAGTANAEAFPTAGSGPPSPAGFNVALTLALLGLTIVVIGLVRHRRGAQLALAVIVSSVVVSCTDDEPSLKSSNSGPNAVSQRSEVITFSVGSIWEVNTDGSQVTEIVTASNGSSYFTSPTVSPDGERIAYIASNREVWVADTNTPSDAAVRIDLYTDASVAFSASDWSMEPRAVHWSPDGEWLLVTRQRCCGSGSADIMLVKPDGSEHRTIVDPGRLPSFPEATWSQDRSPDGRPASIVVVGGDDGVSGVAYDLDGRLIGDALPDQALYFGAVAHQNPAGEGVLITKALGNPEPFGPIVLIDITGEPRIVGGGCGATWSPDGSAIAYYNGRGIVVQAVDEANPEKAVRIVSNADLSLTDPHSVHEEVCTRFSMVWRSGNTSPVQAEQQMDGDDGFRAFAHEIDAAVKAHDSSFFRRRMKTIPVDCSKVTNANQEGGTICETPDAIYDGFISGHWQAGGGTGPAEGAAGAIIRLFDEQEPAATDNYGSGDARVHALNVRPGAYKAVITALVQRDAAVRTVLSTSWTFENGDWRWESPLIIASGVLAEDFLTVNRPETGYNAWERFGVPTAQRAEYLTVAKVDVATGSVTQLAFGRDLSLAKWVNSNVIVGYDSSALAYVALRLDGSFIRTVMTQPADGTLDAWLAPQRDDARVMVHWENRDAFSSLNVLTGEWENFAAINGMNTTPEFAPDGLMAYRNMQDSAQRLVGPEHGVFAEYINRNTELELVPNAWSPDSRYVLGVELELADGRYVSRTYRVYRPGLMATNSAVWERMLGANSDVQWAGQGRLFVFQPKEAAEFMDLSSGAIAEAEAPLQTCCVLSFSPNGEFAVVRQGNGAAWEQRCAVIEVATGREMATILPTKADQETVFCGTTSWSEDSSTVLISAGGT